MKYSWVSEAILVGILTAGALMLVVVSAHAEGNSNTAATENSEEGEPVRPLVQSVVTYNTINGGSAMRGKVARYYRPDYGVISIHPQARARLARPDEQMDEDNQEDSSE